MKTLSRGMSTFTVVLALISSMGCSAGMGVGVFNGLDDEPMNDIVITKSDYDPRTNENPPNDQTYWAITDLAAALGMQVSWQRGSAIEAGLSGAIPGAGIGAASGAVTATLFGGGVGAAPFIAGNAINMGGGYFLNGIITASYGGVYSTGDSLEKAMRDHEGNPDSKYRDENGASLFKYVHVSASFTRTKNKTSRPAQKLEQHLYSGPEVGRTVQREYNRAPVRQQGGHFYGPPVRR